MNFEKQTVGFSITLKKVPALQLECTFPSANLDQDLLHQALQ